MNDMKIIIIFLILIILNGCFYSNCKSLKFPKSELIWMKAYTEGDTLIYINPYNNIFDTFEIVQNTTYFTPCNKIELSNVQYEQLSINANKLSHSTLDNKNNCGFSFYQTMEYIEDTLPQSVKNFSIFGFHSDNIKNLSTELLEVSVKTFLAPNKELKGYYVSFEDKEQNPECFQKIKYLIWSPESGLLKYETYSGDNYVIYKIKHKD